MRHNDDIMNVTITRKELIDLMIAVTTAQYKSGDGGEK